MSAIQGKKESLIIDARLAAELISSNSDRFSHPYKDPGNHKGFAHLNRDMLEDFPRGARLTPMPA